MRLPTRKSACPWCAPSITSGRPRATRRERLVDMTLTSAPTRAASHRPLRRGLQQFMQLLGVELCIAGGEMPARLGTGGDQIEPAGLDAFLLGAFHRGVGVAGSGRMGRVVGGIDPRKRRLDPLQRSGGIVIVRRLPLIE